MAELRSFWAMVGSAPIEIQCVFVGLGVAVMVIFLDILRTRRIK